jgi:hypothetical protein
MQIDKNEGIEKMLCRKTPCFSHRAARVCRGGVRMAPLFIGDNNRRYIHTDTADSPALKDAFEDN